jgi:hypothetical protein
MVYLLTGLLNVAFNMANYDHTSGHTKINHLNGFNS